MLMLSSIHQPKPRYEAALVETVHSYGAAIKGKPRLLEIYMLKDSDSSRLVGLAIFESREDFERLPRRNSLAQESCGRLYPASPFMAQTDQKLGHFYMSRISEAGHSTLFFIYELQYIIVSSS